jgi:3-hydroxyacyl-[acyl-carrier-protein] dehydratase
MSQMQTELDACMMEFHQESEHHIQACFRFPATFAGFKGHFPGQPILPGICMVQAVLCMLRAWENQPVRLREIALAKFYAVVKPGDTITIDGQVAPELEPAEIKAKLTSQDERVAELRLKYEQ